MHLLLQTLGIRLLCNSNADFCTPHICCKPRNIQLGTEHWENLLSQCAVNTASHLFPDVPIKPVIAHSWAGERIRLNFLLEVKRGTKGYIHGQTSRRAQKRSSWAEKATKCKHFWNLCWEEDRLTLRVKNRLITAQLFALKLVKQILQESQLCGW